MPRFTGHGEVVYHQNSNGKTVHPYWGDFRHYWPYKPQEVTPVSQATCIPCTQKAQEPVNYTDAAHWYEVAKTRPSDFHEHVQTLREYADRCKSVAEISDWDHKPAIVALCASSSSRVISACPVPKQVWDTARKFRPDLITCSDDGPIRMEGVDLLFWDCGHRADAIYNALTTYSGVVRKYLVIHCTTDPYGETGDDGGPGVMPGVRRFLNENRQWTAVRHDKNNHGLIILSKVDEEKQQPPGTLRKALNYAKALAAHAQAGQVLVSDQEWQKRLDQCLTCEKRFADVCGICGCPVDKKASWQEQVCPHPDGNKWSVKSLL